MRMGFLKWEIRYPLPRILLLCFVVWQVSSMSSPEASDFSEDTRIKRNSSASGNGSAPDQGTVAPAGPVDPADLSCDTLTSAEATCTPQGGYVVHSDIGSGTEVCLSVTCFDNHTNPHELDLAKKWDKAYVTIDAWPPVPDKDNKVTCEGRTRSTLSVLDVTLGGDKTGLPSKIDFYKAVDLTPPGVTGKVTFRLEMTPPLHLKEVGCEFLDENGAATADTKSSLTLFYFKMSDPIISGPAETELLQSATFQCTTDEAIFESTTEFEVDFRTNPKVEYTAAKPKFERLNPNKAPARWKVTAEMKFVISSILKPRFFVLCYTTNKALDPAAERYAQQRAIDVVIKDKNLDPIFNLVGIASGCGAILVAVGLLVFYQRKRNEAKGPAPVAEAGPV